MRVSTERGDPGYRADYRYIHVFLDGRELSDCVTADEEASMAIVYRRDGTGHLVVDRSLGVIETMVLYGQVRIEAR